MEKDDQAHKPFTVAEELAKSSKAIERLAEKADNDEIALDIKYLDNVKLAP